MLQAGTTFRSHFGIALMGIAAAFFALAGCDSGGGPGENSQVSVGFQTASSSSKATSATAQPKASDEVVISGSNGTLTLTDVRLIVSEVELEGDEDSTDFEASPSFLDLPLDTTDIAPLANSDVPPGTYDEFEFEVENVDPDEDDDSEESQMLEDLFTSIQEEYPNWPEGASMVATGTFTKGDSSSTFTTYFDAEIEVEQELTPPLEVGGDGLSREIVVKLDPAQWFGKSDGTVWNLSQLDYETTQELVEFEAEFEDGVAEIETGDDD